MTLRIATDVGGTFTDVVVAGEGRIGVAKSSSTPGDPVEGTLEALTRVAELRGESRRAMLSRCDVFIHGSTIATNALLEGRTAKVGLICTDGHRDVLLFREGGKDHPFDWDLDYPDPFVPRHLTIGVRERITPEGDVLVPLSDDEVRLAITRLRGFDVEALAVSLLWSFVNPVHELRIARLIAEEWPGVPYSLSHVTNPVMREYRRTMTTCLDAALTPLVAEYVGYLQSSLEAEGLKGSTLFVTASGGATSAEELAARPVYGVDSGPALAPVAGQHFACAAGDGDGDAANLIVCDMGGTSFDVSCVTDGQVAVTSDWRLGHERLSLPRVDVRSIGAGGGSVAWVDSGGLIRIGPRSMGSAPGPACYGRGGTAATVTDAALVLGYYGPDSMRGCLALDVAAAGEAIRRTVAEPLGLDATTAAFTIWAAACAKMTEAVRDVTIRDGLDPREYAMVAGGGAAGAHIVPIAAALGVSRLIIPRLGGVLSAFGGLASDVVREYHEALLTSTEDFAYDRVNRALARLTQRATEFLDKLSIPEERRRLDFFVDCRYPFQEREVAVPLRRREFASASEVRELLEDFHAMHDRLRGSKEPDQMAELTLWRLRASGVTPRPADGAWEGQPAGARPRPRKHRVAYFDEIGGLTETPVWEGADLAEALRIEGPAIIEEPTTTIVVFPRASAELHHGTYTIDVGRPHEA